jgi:hypothetical protein
MKLGSYLCSLAALAMGVTQLCVLGQGLILFDTHMVDARVYYPDRCEPISGGDEFLAQLYAGLETDFFQEPVGIPVGFGTGAEAGYIRGGEVSIPYAPPGTAVWAEVRIWESRFGSWEDAASGGGMVGKTGLVPVLVGDSIPGRLYGLETLWGGCPRQVVLKVARGDSSVDLTWSMQGFRSYHLVVPQEGDTPLGPWGDIDGPWNQEGGINNPPNPIQLTIPSTTKFYRMRITTNIGG